MTHVKRRTLLAAGATLTAAIYARKPAHGQDEGPDQLRPLSAVTPVVPPGIVPAVSFKTLDGAVVGLDSFHGRPLVLNFWATWCVPCVKELPQLEQLAASQPAHGVAVIAVSADRGGAAAVRPFLARHPLTHLQILLDPGSDAVHLLGTVGFPTTLIIDAAGRVRGRLEGPAAWGGAAGLVAKLTA
jgi:thiol-disulfide isomerase/thioredoxin